MPPRLVLTLRAVALARSMGGAGSLGRVLGVPEHVEPPSPRAPATAGAAGARHPVEAVLFDFHGTLAQVEDPVAWVLASASACGVELTRPRATVLADRLVTAGRAGGP